MTNGELNGSATNHPPPQAGPAAPDRSTGTVGSATVRAGLGLTAHQLGELTAGLNLDVGARANYPRYTAEAIHLLVVVSAMRETRVPLDVAVRTVAAYRDPICGGQGWLLCAPSQRGWLSALVLAVNDLTGWLYLTGRCAVVADLGSLAEQAASRWHGLSSVPATTEPSD